MFGNKHVSMESTCSRSQENDKNKVGLILWDGTTCSYPQKIIGGSEGQQPATNIVKKSQNLVASCSDYRSRGTSSRCTSCWPTPRPTTWRRTRWSRPGSSWRTSPGRCTTRWDFNILGLWDNLKVNPYGASPMV